MVVRRIRKDSRGFVRARKAASLRRMEVVGREDEKLDNCAEASSGMAGSAEPFCDACSFKRFLRRCGSSLWLASAPIGPDDATSDGSGELADVSLAGFELRGADALSEFVEAKEEMNPPFNPVAS